MGDKIILSRTWQVCQSPCEIKNKKEKKKKCVILLQPLTLPSYDNCLIPVNKQCKLVKRFPKLNYKYGSPQETYSPS